LKRVETMDPARNNWNLRQKELRGLLSGSLDFPQAIALFLQQHAEVHCSDMSTYGDMSFEDDVLDEMTEMKIREVPVRMDHSVAWILWHLARIEDVTMNMLIANKEQLFLRKGWKERLGISMAHTGNAMSREEVIDLSSQINIMELRRYRFRVGQETVQIVNGLESEDIDQKVSSARIQLIREVGAVVAEAEAILDYWSKRTIAGLLLMPPTRHCFIHLNEAVKIKKRVM
jgi:hypothetical protein